MFRRRSSCAPAAASDDVTVLVVSVDEVSAPDDSEAVWADLRRLIAEALILQDAAEELLLRLRERPDPSEIARPFGRLKGRFAELREALPYSDDADLQRFTAALRQVLDHHVLLLKTSQSLLAGAERSEVLADRLNDVAGLGAQGRRLEDIRAEILPRSTLALLAAA